MIVVMVYRPEACEGPHQASYQDDFDPFNGVEIYGMYYEAEKDHVMEMVNNLKDQHPGWHFLIDPSVKSQVGFNADALKVPKEAGERKR